MSGINKVILIGNLGKDPEVRYTTDNKPVANITVATSETWKDKNTGEKQEKTEWHRVVFFGRLAEVVAEFLKKGSRVYIEGKIQTRKWQGEDGQDRYTTEIHAREMQMLDIRSQADEASAQPQRTDRGAQPQNNGGGQQDGGFEDDIPFANPYKRAEYIV